MPLHPTLRSPSISGLDLAVPLIFSDPPTDHESLERATGRAPDRAPAGCSDGCVIRMGPPGEGGGGRMGPAEDPSPPPGLAGLLLDTAPGPAAVLVGPLDYGSEAGVGRVDSDLRTFTDGSAEHTSEAKQGRPVDPLRTKGKSVVLPGRSGCADRPTPFEPGSLPAWLEGTRRPRGAGPPLRLL